MKIGKIHNNFSKELEYPNVINFSFGLIMNLNEIKKI